MLRQLGITASDTVATCLGGGQEAAGAFLSVAGVCCCAPINPDLADEAEFYLGDSGAKALVVSAGDTGAVRGAAHRLGIKIVEYPMSGAGASGQGPRAAGVPHQSATSS